MSHQAQLPPLPDSHMRYHSSYYTESEHRKKFIAYYFNWKLEIIWVFLKLFCLRSLPFFAIN